MKIDNRHERFIAAPPELVAKLISDFESLWPTEIGPVPVEEGPGLYKAGAMLWQQVDRPGAARAFRVLRPEGLQVEHWFELEPRDGGTVLRHTVAGRATVAREDFWRDLEPHHDRTLEALFDNAEAAAARGV